MLAHARAIVAAGLALLFLLVQIGGNQSPHRVLAAAIKGQVASCKSSTTTTRRSEGSKHSLSSSSRSQNQFEKQHFEQQKSERWPSSSSRRAGTGSEWQQLILQLQEKIEDLKDKIDLLLDARKQDSDDSDVNPIEHFEPV